MSAWRTRIDRAQRVAAAGICLLAVIAGQAQQSREIAIRAGHLVDPVTGTVAANQIIRIRDGRIVEVGPTVPISPGADVRDLTSSWVMPGLLDAHTHLTEGVPPGGGLIQVYLRETSASHRSAGSPLVFRWNKGLSGVMSTSMPTPPKRLPRPCDRISTTAST